MYRDKKLGIKIDPVLGLIEDPPDARDYNYVQSFQEVLNALKKIGAPEKCFERSKKDMTLDQKSNPWCVAYAGALQLWIWSLVHEINYPSSVVTRKFNFKNEEHVLKLTQLLYEESRKLFKEEYGYVPRAGTTSRHLCKLFKNLGWAKSYHLISVDQPDAVENIKIAIVICQSLLWSFFNMDYDSRTGLISPSGAAENGHCVAGGNFTPNIIGGRNSWGPNWGDAGKWRFLNNNMNDKNISVRAMIPNKEFQV